MTSFAKIKEYLEKGIDPHSLSPMVIVKTIIEKGLTAKTKLDNITKEIEFYNKDSNSNSKPAIREAIDVLIKKEIIEEDPKNEFILNLDSRADCKIEDQLELISLCNRKIYFHVNAHYEPVKINPDYFLAGGPVENWNHTLQNMPMRWGVEMDPNSGQSEAQQLATWNSMNSGDIVFFYAQGMKKKKDEHLICFGFGIVKKKYQSADQYYPQEQSAGQAVWTHRVDLDPILVGFGTEDVTNDIILESEKEGVLDLKAMEHKLYQRAFFHFKDSEQIKKIIEQVEPQISPLSLPKKEDLENMHLKDLILAYDKDPYLFGPGRTPIDVIHKMCMVTKELYLDKIDKLTVETYATGYDQTRNRITQTFCSGLERLLQDIGKLRDDHFGVRYKKNHELSIGRLTQFPTKDDAMDQIKEDMRKSVQWSDSSFETISEEIKNTKGCFHDDIFYATLFVLKPDTFLPITDLIEMQNVLTVFGVAFDDIPKDLVLMQKRLLDMKKDHSLMEKWSNYDFAYFAIKVWGLINIRTNHVLCRFKVPATGELSSSYSFSDAEESHDEIQDNSKLIYFDMINDEDLKWWGEAKVEKVTRRKNDKHQVKISKFTPFGDIQDPSTMTEASAKLSDEDLENELRNKFDFINQTIIPIDSETYEKIIGDLSISRSQFLDKNLELPDPSVITKGKEDIRENLLIDDEVIDKIIAALYSGKSVLLTGPVGCGKTELAKAIPKTWMEGGYYPQITTATADWTTQDVIGGIVPKLIEKDVKFVVQPGYATDAASENWRDGIGKEGIRTYVRKEGTTYRGVWLVIDEFNRADMDKAFGSLFTALEYRQDPGIKIPSNVEGVLFDTITVPKDFRIIGTLNTKDKNTLFQMSDALKRRFEIIEIKPPTFKDYKQEIEIVAKKVFKQLDDNIKSTLSLGTAEDLTKDNTELSNYLKFAYEILAFVRRYNELGTALLIAIIKFMIVFHALEDKDSKKYELQDCLDVALCNSILPQIEKLSVIKLESIKNFLNNTIHNTFDVEYSEDFESIKRIEELVKLIKFLNDHDANLIADDWKNHFMNSNKEDRENAQNHDKYKLGQLNPWKLIFKHNDIKGENGQTQEVPKFKRFAAALEKIMSDKGFQTD